MKKLISWVEIPATNFERAVNFYSEVFEMNLQKMEGETEKMACFPNNEGAISLSPGFKPSKQGVLPSFQAPSAIDVTLKRIVSKGGKILKQKTKIEADGLGYFALFVDSEGNRIGLYGEN